MLIFTQIINLIMNDKFDEIIAIKTLLKEKFLCFDFGLFNES